MKIIKIAQQVDVNKLKDAIAALNDLTGIITSLKNITQKIEMAGLQIDIGPILQDAITSGGTNYIINLQRQLQQTVQTMSQQKQKMAL
jgi:hypothetical protein